MRHGIATGASLLAFSLLHLLFKSCELLQRLLLLGFVGFIALLVLVTFFTNGGMHTLAHDRFSNTTLDVFIGDISLLFQFFQRWSLIDPVVCAQSKEKDVFCPCDQPAIPRAVKSCSNAYPWDRHRPSQSDP